MVVRKILSFHADKPSVRRAEHPIVCTPRGFPMVFPPVFVVFRLRRKAKCSAVPAGWHRAVPGGMQPPAVFLDLCHPGFPPARPCWQEPGQSFSGPPLVLLLLLEKGTTRGSPIGWQSRPWKAPGSSAGKEPCWQRAEPRSGAFPRTRRDRCGS